MSTEPKMKTGIAVLLLLLAGIGGYFLLHKKAEVVPAPTMGAPAITATSTQEKPKPVVVKPKDTREEDIKSYLVNLQGTTASTTVIDSINAIRTIQRVNVLTVSDKLNEVAKRRADDMVARNYWSHRDADGNLQMVVEANAVGYEYIYLGENLACGGVVNDKCLFEGVNLYEKLGTLMTAWMNSPTHRENILKPQYTEIGVYAGQNLVVVIFASPVK